MGLLESSLLSLCMSSSTMPGQACNNAVQATGKQSGIFEMSTRYEDHQVRLLEQGANNYWGNTVTETVAGVVWVAKSVSDKRAHIGLPTLGICSSMVAEVGQEKSMLILKWFF
jgi:hypothetical protein